MSDSLAAWVRRIAGHWKKYLLIFLGVLIALMVASALAPAPPSENFTVPNAPSQKALDLFEAHDKELAGVSATVVFRADDITEPKNVAAVTRAMKKIEQLPNVIKAENPILSKPPTVSPDKKIAMASILYDLNDTDVTKAEGEALLDAARTAENGSVQVAAGGELIDASAGGEPPYGELIGILLAIVLLTLLFRSGASMIATLGGALLGVLFGQLLLTVLAPVFGMPEFAKTIAIMLGLGAGIDYSLLILSRYREQRGRGDSNADALAKSAATSGASVVAAGMIVVVAIAGLLVIGIPLIGKMGIGAAIGVAAVVVSSLTALPVIITALRKRIRPRDDRTILPSKRFEHWAELTTGKPWLSIIAGVVIMLVFASPFIHMRLGQPDDGNEPKGETQRTAYDWISEGFGPGFNGPFLVTVALPENMTEADKADLVHLTKELKTDDVALVAPPELSKDKKIAVINLIPKTSPQDEATSELLTNLRNTVVPKAVAGSGLEVYIGGQTAGFDDFSAQVSKRLPVFILLVIGLSILLLMAAFRSFWIPLVSAAFNLLSVAAAYGVITAVFQKGIGASLIGAETGVPIISFIPVIVFAILFGLSMDYNVFLLSRIKEAYHEGESPRDSVILGVGRIGKIILFAGLIMTSVFLAFVTQSDVTTKMFGLGLGAAVLMDVLFIRLLIAPSVVYLLGDKAWWMPGWLDRILPNISLEGHLVDNKEPKEEAIIIK